MREIPRFRYVFFGAAVFSTEPIYKTLETVLLTDSLGEMQDALGKNNPDVQKVLQGKSPADAAKD